jgi:phage gp45-like
MKSIKNAVERTIKNIRISIMGTISSILKDSNTVYATLNEDEEIRDIKIISPYGFFSLPLNNSNGQLLFNNTSKKVSLIGIDHINLPVELNPGESLIYCESGSYVLLKDGKVFVKGDLSVDGNITYSGNISKG